MPHHLFFGCEVSSDARPHVIHPAAAARQWLEYMATEHTVFHPTSMMMTIQPADTEVSDSAVDTTSPFPPFFVNGKY